MENKFNLQVGDIITFTNNVGYHVKLLCLYSHDFGVNLHRCPRFAVPCVRNRDICPHLKFFQRSNDCVNAAPFYYVLFEFYLSRALLSVGDF